MTGYKTCPVCGLSPKATHGEVFKFCDICPSCGTQFGYSDSGREHSELLDHWEADGYPWRSRTRPTPENWDPIEQLKAAGLA